MMREKGLAVAAVVLAAFMTSVAPAAAQVRPTSAASGDQSSWFIGGMGGGAAVQNLGGAFGGEVGTSLSPRIVIFAEGLGVTDTATRRRIDLAQSVATVLQQSQGTTASATLKAPAGIFLGGIRYIVHQSGNLRLFVQGEGGFARVTYQPQFLLNGADVTSQLTQFGITLGSDLAGTATAGAFGGGLGLEVRHGVWYVGAQVGLLSIQTPSQPSNVIQATASFGRWF